MSTLEGYNAYDVLARFTMPRRGEDVAAVLIGISEPFWLTADKDNGDLVVVADRSRSVAAREATTVTETIGTGIGFRSRCGMPERAKRVWRRLRYGRSTRRYLIAAARLITANAEHGATYGDGYLGTTVERQHWNQLEQAITWLDWEAGRDA